MFGDPFANELADVIDQVQKPLGGPKFHRHKTLVCMEGIHTRVVLND
jgi:hypothetical protein